MAQYKWIFIDIPFAAHGLGLAMVLRCLKIKFGIVVAGGLLWSTDVIDVRGKIDGVAAQTPATPVG